MKRILKIVIFIYISIFASVGINAYSMDKHDYKAAILIEANTGKILYEYNKDEILPQASITKLMTYYTLRKFLKQKSINENDKIKIEINKFNMPGDASKVNLKKGDSLSIKDVINTMLIASANDSALEAEYIYDKNNQNIINSMNNNSKALGLDKSRYFNVTGLTIKNGSSKKYNVTTAYELSKLAMDIIHDYPEILKTTAKKEYKFKGELFKNTNQLINTMPGVDGLKTGYTNEAGYCLVATKNVTNEIGSGKNTRLLAVVLGCSSDASRFNEGRTLLKYGEDNFINDRILVKNSTIKIANEFYNNNYINGTIHNDFYFLRNKNDKVLKAIVLNKDLPKNINKGDKIGKIIINIGNVKTESVLYAKDNNIIKPLYIRILIKIMNFFNGLF